MNPNIPAIAGLLMALAPPEPKQYQRVNRCVRCKADIHHNAVLCEACLGHPPITTRGRKLG